MVTTGEGSVFLLLHRHWNKSQMIQINFPDGYWIVLAAEQNALFDFLCKRLVARDDLLSLELFWIEIKPFQVCRLILISSVAF